MRVIAVELVHSQYTLPVRASISGVTLQEYQSIIATVRGSGELMSCKQKLCETLTQADIEFSHSMKALNQAGADLADEITARRAVGKSKLPAEPVGDLDDLDARGFDTSVLRHKRKLEAENEKLPADERMNATDLELSARKAAGSPG